jgi:hypothetical protein
MSDLSPDAARQLAAAMIDETAAREQAARNAPRDALQTRVSGAFPVLSKRFQITAAEDGSYATIAVDNAGGEVRLVAGAGGGFDVAPLAGRGRRFSAHSEEALLDAIQRVQAEHGYHGPAAAPQASATPPAAGRDAAGRFAGRPAEQPAERPNYRFTDPRDAEW